MTVGAVGAIAGIGASFAAVVGLFIMLRDRVRARVADDTRERAAIQGHAFSEGQRSRDDEVRQLKFERDDARRERDDAKQESRDLRGENRALRDRRQ